MTIATWYHHGKYITLFIIYDPDERIDIAYVTWPHADVAPAVIALLAAQPSDDTLFIYIISLQSL